MSRKRERKKKSIWYILGGIVFTAGMCVIMPKLIEKGSEYLYRKSQIPFRWQDDDEWNPEVVKKSTVEEE